jgi:hypothetical protein
MAAQQLDRHINSGRATGATDSVTVEAVNHFAANVDARKCGAKLRNMSPMQGNFVTIEQPRLGQKKICVIDADQTQTVTGGAAQERRIVACQSCRSLGSAAAKNHQIVINLKVNLFGGDINADSHPATEANRIGRQVEHLPSTKSLPTVIFIVSGKPQFVEKATEWQQGEFR